MKRAPFVVGATGVGLGLLFSYHTKPIHVSIASSAEAGADTGAGGPAGTTANPTGTTTPTTTGGSSPAPTTGGDTPTTSSTPTTPTTAPTPTTTVATRSATGQDIAYQYGDIQLKVTEKGTRITRIQVIAEGATDPRSAEINSQAVPILQQQAMSVQSANVDGVSGATFTSIAYQQALQSALDQLH